MTDSPSREPLPYAWARFQEALLAFLIRRSACRADAEDLFQEILLKLRKHETAIDPRRLGAWLFSTARNQLTDYHRRRARASTTKVLPLEPGYDEPVESPATAIQELSACVQPFLDLLNKADRELLKRIDIDNQSQVALARKLKVSESTIKSRVQRARRRLRALFEQCCEFEWDRRGTPSDYTLRSDRSHSSCCADHQMATLRWFRGVRGGQAYGRSRHSAMASSAGSGFSPRS